MNPNDPSFDSSVEAMQEFCLGKWNSFLSGVDQMITQHGQSNYCLIGERMTLADISVSSFFLRFQNDKYLLHRQLLIDHLEQNFGKVYQYAYFQN